MQRLIPLTLIPLMALAACLPDGAVDADGDGVAAGEDCDDASAAVGPDEPERCGDGIDQDCDGVVDEGFDADGDGYLVCQVAGQLKDCDDTDALVSPDGIEVCGDGVDNDCDGVTDTRVDGYEPNNSRATASYLGEVDDTTISIQATTYLSDGADLRDYYVIEATEEDTGSDDFTLIVQLRDIPSGVDLDLEVEGPSGQSGASSRPGNADEDVQIHATRFNESGEYSILVKLVAKDGSPGVDCMPYTLNVIQDG